MMHWRMVCLLAVLTGGLGGTAPADTYGTARIAYLYSYGGVAGYEVDYDYDGVWDRARYDNVHTGQYQFALDASSSSPTVQALLSDTFGAFCIDVTQDPSAQWSTYTLVDLEDAPLTGAMNRMSPQKADDIRELFGRILYSPWDSASPGLGGYQGGGPRAAMAMAVALWEIVFEKPGLPYDLSSGHFVINGMDWGTDAVAQGWLNRITRDPVWRDQRILALVSADFQDYALSVPGLPEREGPLNALPEPLTLLMAGGSLAGLGAYLRGRGVAPRRRVVGLGGAPAPGRRSSCGNADSNKEAAKTAASPLVRSAQAHSGGA